MINSTVRSLGLPLAICCLLIAAPVVVADPPLIILDQDSFIIPGGILASDEFGFSVCFDANQLLVGARRYPNFSNPGYTRLFDYDSQNNTWTESTEQLPSEVGVDNFGDYGAAVSLFGNTAVVSAPLDNLTGSIFIYLKETVSWSKDSEFSGTSDFEKFGTSLSQSADRIVVGAPEYDDCRGAVYIYKLHVTDGWTLSEI